MATTREDIKTWFLKGKEQKATHMIVVCDTYDLEDYPVYVMPGENVHEKHAEYRGKNMQKVMEVYSLRKNIESQLNERRAFHFD